MTPDTNLELQSQLQSQTKKEDLIMDKTDTDLLILENDDMFYYKKENNNNDSRNDNSIVYGDGYNDVCCDSNTNLHCSLDDNKVLSLQDINNVLTHHDIKIPDYLKTILMLIIIININQ